MRNRRRLRGRIGLWSLGALLGACTVGPDYRAPDAAVPQFAGGAPAQSGGDLGQWWQSFDDPVLDGLITQALHDNLDVQAAASRIREARLQEVVAGAAAWPSLQAHTQATRTHLSGNAISLGNLGTLTGGAVSSSSASGGRRLGCPAPT